MKRLSLYPDQMLCFVLGFLPTGVWVCTLALGVKIFLNTIAGENYQSSLPIVAVKTIFLYGIPGGVIGLLMGYLLRKIRANSNKRWIWLSLLIPQITFVVAGFEVELENMIECNLLRSEHKLGDWIWGLCVYQCAALVSSLIIIVVVAAFKLMQKIVRSKRADLGYINSG
jgi:hypothetical protein